MLCKQGVEVWWQYLPQLCELKGKETKQREEGLEVKSREDTMAQQTTKEDRKGRGKGITNSWQEKGEETCVLLFPTCMFR